MEIYEYRQERENLWIISERYSGEKFSQHGALTIPLVVGEKLAAVLDSGMGISRDLRKVCETITDKPLINLVGHGHPDHAGGSPLFDKVFMSKKDEPELAWAMKKEKRLADVAIFGNNNQELTEYARTHCIPDESFAFEDIEDGARFDLGGVVLEAVAVPGHTRGSMCFVNWRDNYAYTSDCMNPSETLAGSSTAPTQNPAPMACFNLSQYRGNLARFVSMVPGDMMLYMGHISQPTTMQIPRQLLTVCDEILAGRTQEDQVIEQMNLPFQCFAHPMSIHRYRNVEISYNAEDIF